MNSKNVIVRFLQPYHNYCRGDTAGFRPERADEILKTYNKLGPVAEKVGKAKPSKVEEPGGPKPVEQMEARRRITADDKGAIMKRPR